MGLIEGFRKRRAENQHNSATVRFSSNHEKWSREMARIDEMIGVVRDCIAGRPETHFPGTDDYGFMLTAGEFPVCFLQGAAYLENVRTPARHSGGYGGVSFPIFGRVRVNTGRLGGTTIPGKEQTTMTDEGNALVTNTRVMFVGPRRSHEWRFDKMINMTHVAEGYTVFAMKGRSKPSGIGYGVDAATDVQFRLELGSAMALGTLPRYESELVAEKNQLEAQRPVPPPPLAP